MDLLDAMKARHSVRSYTDKRIDGEVWAELTRAIDEVNAESGLHIQLVCDEPKAFGGAAAHYGHFENCRNYLAIVGKGPCGETAGYYGEKLVLFLQTLGLNSCWVAMSYDKGKTPCAIGKGEKLQIVIALGYGATQGVPHRNKPTESVCRMDENAPAWFGQGVEAALTAPTAINQQKFFFELKDGKVKATAGLGFYSKTDLGIAKYHFELGAGKASFEWS